MAFFSEVVQVFGVPKSVGQIYGLLYATPEPLSFSDIVDRLDISKGSASQGLQLLRSLGAVNVAEVKPVGSALAAGPSPKAVAMPGAFSVPPNAGDAKRSIRIAYEPELSLRKLMGGLLRERLDPLMKERRARMQCLRAAAENAESDAQREFQLDRLGQLGTWQRQATLIMPVFKKLNNM